MAAPLAPQAKAPQKLRLPHPFNKWEKAGDDDLWWPSGTDYSRAPVLLVQRNRTWTLEVYGGDDNLDYITTITGPLRKLPLRYTTYLLTGETE